MADDKNDMEHESESKEEKDHEVPARDYRSVVIKNMFGYSASQSKRRIAEGKKNEIPKKEE